MSVVFVASLNAGFCAYAASTLPGSVGVGGGAICGACVVFTALGLDKLFFDEIPEENLFSSLVKKILHIVSSIFAGWKLAESIGVGLSLKSVVILQIAAFGIAAKVALTFFLVAGVLSILSATCRALRGLSAQPNPNERFPGNGVNDLNFNVGMVNRNYPQEYLQFIVRPDDNQEEGAPQGNNMNRGVLGNNGQIGREGEGDPDDYQVEGGGRLDF